MEIPQIAPFRLPGPLPPFLTGAAEELIRLAERLLPGQGRGASKKALVATALRKLLREHDIKAVPDWIEGPAEELIVDVVIEAVFQLIRKGPS